MIGTMLRTMLSSICYGREFEGRIPLYNICITISSSLLLVDYWNLVSLSSFWI